MNATDVLKQEDPDFLKAIRRQRRWVIGLCFFALLAVLGAAYAIAGVVQTEKRVTKVEQSPCTAAEAEPDNRKVVMECQKIRAAGERAANAEVNCIPLVRAGYICPKPGSPLDRERRIHERSEAERDGDATDPTAARSQDRDGGKQVATAGGGEEATAAPGPGGTGRTTAPQRSGADHERRHPPASPKSPPPAAAPAPSGGGSTSGNARSDPATGSTQTEHTTEVVHEPAPSPPAEEAPAATAPEHPAPVAEGVGKAVEDVGATVEETGSTVNEAVHGVTCTVGLAC